MIDAIEGVTVVVSDQQRAVDFYTQRLGFEKKLDTDVAGYRWVVVGPKGSDTVISIVDPEQMKGLASEQGKASENRDEHRDMVLRRRHRCRIQGIKIKAG